MKGSITKENTEFLHLCITYGRRYGLRVYAKDRKWSTLWNVLTWILKIVSLGKHKGLRKYYVTTLGRYVFFPAGWKARKATYSDCAVLRHEAKHIHQNKWLGLGCIWVGTIVMALLYLFLPLPVGLAYFRYLLERYAYLESYRARKEYGLPIQVGLYIDALAGPSYLWAWPKNLIRQWFLKNCV